MRLVLILFLFVGCGPKASQVNKTALDILSYGTNLTPISFYVDFGTSYRGFIEQWAIVPWKPERKASLLKRWRELQSQSAGVNFEHTRFMFVEFDPQREFANMIIGPVSGQGSMSADGLQCRTQNEFLVCTFGTPGHRKFTVNEEVRRCLQGAVLCAAANLNTIPRIPQDIDRAYLRVTRSKLSGTLSGGHSINVVQPAVNIAMEMGKTAIAKKLASTTDPFERFGAIWLEEFVLNIFDQLSMQTVDNQFSFSLPLDDTSGVTLLALTGIVAAIAIPQFVKYMEHAEEANVLDEGGMGKTP